MSHAAATKGVLVELELVGADEVEPADKHRAVRTTPRPTTDENTVLLAIFRGIDVLCGQRRAQEPRVEGITKCDAFR